MSRTMYSARDVMMPSNVTPYEMSGMDNSMFIQYAFVLTLQCAYIIIIMNKTLLKMLCM